MTATTVRMRDAEVGAMHEAADADLMRRTADGDREAFAALYRRHHASVYRFARLMTGSPSDAEDIVQEAFLVLMRDARRYDPARASLSTYLYGVARHHTRRRLAAARALVTFDDEEPIQMSAEDDPDARLERRQELQRLRRAIVSLPARYREVVVLCDLQNVSYHDAAAAIGCALGTIRSRLHRARHLLLRKLGGASATGGAARERVSMRCAV